MTMNITTKFSIGDTVYMTSCDRMTVPIGKCALCEGTGHLILKDGRTIACQFRDDKYQCESGQLTHNPLIYSVSDGKLIDGIKIEMYHKSRNIELYHVESDKDYTWINSDYLYATVKDAELYITKTLEDND